MENKCGEESSCYIGNDGINTYEVTGKESINSEEVLNCAFFNKVKVVADWDGVSLAYNHIIDEEIIPSPSFGGGFVRYNPFTNDAFADDDVNVIVHKVEDYYDTIHSKNNKEWKFKRRNQKNKWIFKKTQHNVPKCGKYHWRKN